MNDEEYYEKTENGEDERFSFDYPDKLQKIELTNRLVVNIKNFIRNKEMFNDRIIRELGEVKRLKKEIRSETQQPEGDLYDSRIGDRINELMDRYNDFDAQTRLFKSDIVDLCESLLMFITDEADLKKNLPKLEYEEIKGDNFTMMEKRLKGMINNETNNS